MSDYPEHDKMMAVAEKSHAIGEFLDSAPYVLCERNGDAYGRYTAVGKDINQILADYFGIDLKKIEAEKRQMLAAMKSAS